MSVFKYKDPKTGEFKRINPYGNIGKAVEITEISGETALSDDIITELQNDLNWISYGGGAYRFVSVEEDKRLYSYTTEDKISQILVNTLTKTCVLRETQITAASVADSIVKRDSYGEIPVSTPSRDSSATNKAYVDEADKNLRLKLSNLEQALNGYILDTTKEAYADLDSAVLKNSVAVGDNVYPIADKTRALVSRIEGKTTKMVQVLDKSTFPATKSVVGLTVTKTDDGGLHVLGTTTGGGGRNSWDITVEIKKGHRYLSLLKGNKNLSSPIITLKSDLSQYFSISNIATSTIEGECNYGFNVTEGDYDETIYPQLFDLTAMNREDITTVEQFKAEFPELYPYENGNIYPVKISGVKFTGKNLLDFNTVSRFFNEIIIGLTINVEDDKVHITGSPTQLGSLNIIKTSNLSLIGKNYRITAFDITGSSIPSTVSLYGLRNIDINGEIALNLFTSGMEVGKSYDFYFKVMVSAKTPTAYEPYTEPVSVTLPETYDLHGIGDYKDYLEITKNEDNELYTLKKVQNVEVNESEKTITPLATPVETVIATNLTYEQVTAIRHNGGLIEVEGNVNKGYARPTIKNTVVYRLTATNTTEG